MRSRTLGLSLWIAFLLPALRRAAPWEWEAYETSSLRTAAFAAKTAADGRVRGAVAPEGRSPALDRIPIPIPATLEIAYSESMQPLVDVKVGGQELRLVFDTSSANTAVLVLEMGACGTPALLPCYSYRRAEAGGSLKVCAENRSCEASPGARFPCLSYLGSLADASSHPDQLIIDGVQYSQKTVEGRENMTVVLQHHFGGPSPLHGSCVPVRLLVAAMKVGESGFRVGDSDTDSDSQRSFELFAGASGILGTSGPSLSCREGSLWSLLLEREKAEVFALDFRPPPAATLQELPGPSRVVINPGPAELKGLTWSQRKQSGDIINDGMHELLIYHLEICGVDLLYNTSSNWLVVLDTSGPCLTLPPFLFQRLISRIAVDCPFGPGEPARGRLCEPRRWQHPASNGSGSGSGGGGGGGGGAPTNTGIPVLLPALTFSLADVQEEFKPPRLHLPLERLRFRAGAGEAAAEYLCVARDDSSPERPSADMMSAHIGFGSMVVSALHTVINLQNRSIGLRPRGALRAESSSAFCVPSVKCRGLQTYFPPLNLCEDPRCADYLLMVLDEGTKTCRWSRAVVVSFGLLLAVLVALDLTSHRLYKQAIEKASDANL